MQSNRNILESVANVIVRFSKGISAFLPDHSQQRRRRREQQQYDRAETAAHRERHSQASAVLDVSAAPARAPAHRGLGHANCNRRAAG